MKRIKEQIVKANEQLQKIRTYITEHEGMFDSMDLKLHDASYYEYRDMEKDFPLCYADNEGRCEDSYFYRFCEVTYDQFTEWCKEEKIDFAKMRHHIGRTSSFYLYNKGIIQRERCIIRWDWTMDACFNELGYSSYYQLVKFNKEGNVDEEETLDFDVDYWTQDDWLDEIRPALQYIIDEMYDDFMKEIEDIVKVYGYIKDTKDNQVEYFKEYLEWNEADLQYEKDKENAEMLKRTEIISKMPEKIHSIMQRSALDSDDLDVVLGCMV